MSPLTEKVKLMALFFTYGVLLLFVSMIFDAVSIDRMNAGINISLGWQEIVIPSHD